MSAVAPYCGQDQVQKIQVPAQISYRQIWEESAWVMPPYSGIFPGVVSEQSPGPVPPPIYKTDLWTAQATFPL